jgi:hypothetical protein
MSFGFSRGKCTIMITTVRSIAAAILIAAIAMPAHAQSVSTRPELSLTQISERLGQQGFRVLEIERDDGSFEVKAFNSNGQCVEMDVDRRSGDVVRTKRDDDCGVSADNSHRNNDARGR